MISQGPATLDVSPWAETIAELQRLSSDGVCLNVDLAKVSRWRVGGIADCIVSPSKVEEVAGVISFLHRAGIPHVILGSSSNVLFADEGLRAVGVHVGSRIATLTIDGDLVSCDAGHHVPLFARRVGRAGLSGAEHVCGIPGTLGGLICMNGGSMRRGIGENALAVTSIDQQGRIVTRATEECGFAYRRSIFQDNAEIIVRARFSFSERDAPAVIRTRMLAILRDRRRKFPQKLPNCGSVFVSDPAMYSELGPPGAVIEKLGLKGMKIGGAQVSPLHANFVVNTGNAKARDILALVGQIRDIVRDRTGYTMLPEGKHVLPDGRIVPLC